MKGHLEAVGDSNDVSGFYDKYVKRGFDVIFSFVALVVLLPVYVLISIVIVIDDPGSVFFTQKRVGKNKEYFELHKFRTMKMSTPHDVPTHMLENPDQYITRVGRFLRKHSLDELPQIWDIFVGNMSVVGPRPALWNQDLLTAERDKYGANDVKPGLTGWAQINGRDELEISEKAKLDGEYCENIGLRMDVKCFLGSFGVLAHDDSVFEGGTGEKKRKELNKGYRHYTDGKSDAELIGHIGFGEKVQVDRNVHRRVLITGADSYIGETFRTYAEKNYKENFSIDCIDMLDGSWREADFSIYDIIYHVAGIAHADVGKASEETKEKYYEVNTDLAVEVCRKAKDEGVKEFVFMSSMIVYGESAAFGVKKVIDEHTVPAPVNFYGDSKLQADVGIRELANDSFKVIILRPPMIYGKGSKGNYPILAKLAKKISVFPDVKNERSMLYIGNLCEFLCQVMLVDVKQNATVLIPQNGEWVKTSQMVDEIAKISGKKILKLRILNPMVSVSSKMPGKIGRLTNKAFGNMAYDQNLSRYEGIDYQQIDMRETIFQTERDVNRKSDQPEQIQSEKHILVISQYFYPEQFRINDICQDWIKRGYKVTVVTGIPNYPQGEFYEGYDYEHNRTENWKGIDIIRLAVKPRKSGLLNLGINYLSFVEKGLYWIKKTEIKADIVFIYEVSPMTQALVGVWYAKKNKIRCNLYVTDLWPENVEIVLGNHNRIFLGLIGIMVDYIYKRCDYIFTSSESFINAIAERGVDRKKLIFWPQYAEDFYRKKDRADPLEIPNDGTLNLIFAGNLGTAQGLDVLASTAALLKKRGTYVRFNMVGEGRYEDELKKDISKHGVTEYFNFIPAQPAEKIPEYFAWSDAALITLAKSKVYSMTVPAKTQSCLACGMPVIISADGEVQKIVRDAGCGFYSDSGDTDGLADNIELFLNLSPNDRTILSENALNYYRLHFEKKSLMDKMKGYL